MIRLPALDGELCDKPHFHALRCSLKMTYKAWFGARQVSLKGAISPCCLLFHCSPMKAQGPKSIVSPEMVMLSVFITPWMKPTCSHLAINAA